MSSSVICKVNKAWRDALAAKRFKLETVYRTTRKNAWSIYNVAGNALKDCKLSTIGKFVCFVESCKPMGCCGTEELTFAKLQEGYEAYKDDPDWDELVAKYIRFGISEVDNRVLILGVPVQVATHSIYNVHFYEKVKDSLLRFGFRQIGEEYKNQNSGNRIIVLAGQL